MIKKAKTNIKHIDRSINIAYNSLTFLLVVFVSILAIIAKSAVVTTT